MTNTDLFQSVDLLPDSDARDRYQALVGLDPIKARLEKEAAILLHPDALSKWSKKHHEVESIPAGESLQNRTALFVFAGDVGTGKTALAETFGDAVARSIGADVLLFRLSLSSRGTGAVGEMTRLLASAFAEVEKEIPPRKNATAPISNAGILLIDEADALAQSRELSQMHHEDRAGVNALIRGIDGLAVARRPVITVMATNRLSALDPAVRRRAAATFEFGRPNEEQRFALLEKLLAGTAITPEQIQNLAHLTGADGRDYGFTYSDIVNRVIPAAVIAAFPDKPLTFDVVVTAITDNPPTPPFGASHAA